MMHETDPGRRGEIFVASDVGGCAFLGSLCLCYRKEMDIGFVWDERKYQVTVKKHNVQFYEVVSAFDDPNGYEVPDPAKHEDRWLWVGRTPWDRVLVIIYSEEDLPLYRIITAYDAERRWLDEYY